MSSGDAQARGWGPPGQSATIVTINVAGISLPVRREMAVIFRFLLDGTVNLGYRLDGKRDDWGYAYRKIAGTNTWSNHAWGLAVDLNAIDNPQQRGLHTNMPQAVVNLWRNHGFRWGGDYAGGTKKDPMHYEYMGTPASAAVLTANINGVAGLPGPIAPPPAAQPPPVVVAPPQWFPSGPPTAPTQDDDMRIFKTSDGKFWLAGAGNNTFFRRWITEDHANKLRWGGVPFSDLGGDQGQSFVFIAQFNTEIPAI